MIEKVILYRFVCFFRKLFEVLISVLGAIKIGVHLAAYGRESKDTSLVFQDRSICVSRHH